MSVSRLLLDVGNSRLKWLLVHTDQVSLSGSVAYRDDHDAWQRFKLPDGARPDEVWVGSVAGETVDAKLRVWCNAHALPTPTFARVRKNHLGLTVAYADVTKLGVDRWLAMLGARRLVETALCVADVGTALTLDCVTADGNHEGGLIAPGPELMMDALLRDTAQIREASRNVPTSPFAADTGDAVRAGACYAAAALIDRFVTLAQERVDSDLPLFLTGGGRRLVAPLLATQAHDIPDLVPHGLLALADGEGASP